MAKWIYQGNWTSFIRAHVIAQWCLCAQSIQVTQTMACTLIINEFSHWFRLRHVIKSKLSNQLCLQLMIISPVAPFYIHLPKNMKVTNYLFHTL